MSASLPPEKPFSSLSSTRISSSLLALLAVLMVGAAYGHGWILLQVGSVHYAVTGVDCGVLMVGYTELSGESSLITQWVWNPPEEHFIWPHLHRETDEVIAYVPFWVPLLVLAASLLYQRGRYAKLCGKRHDAT